MAASWRDRLALWCLRRLTPKGLLNGGDEGLRAEFDPGNSLPQEPKLVMRFRYHDQLIISLVMEPDHVVEQIQEAVDWLHAWAAEELAKEGAVPSWQI